MILQNSRRECCLLGETNTPNSPYPTSSCCVVSWQTPGVRTRNASPRKTRTAREEGRVKAPRPRRPELQTLWGLDFGIRVRRGTRFEEEGGRSRRVCDSPRQEGHTFGAPASAVLLTRRRRRIWAMTRRSRREVSVGHTADDYQVYRWTPHSLQGGHCSECSRETMAGSSVSMTNSRGKRSRGIPSRSTRNF